jgi:phage tail-like protein
MANYYPPVSFYFEVGIAEQGGNDASFAEVSGLDAEREVMELKEGGENRYSHRLPGRAKYGNLVLKRGLMLASSPLFDWCKAVLESDFETPVRPRDVSVSLLDRSGSPLINWNIRRAWPVKWSLGAFNAQQNELAMETLELAYAFSTRERKRELRATGMFIP